MSRNNQVFIQALPKTAAMIASKMGLVIKQDPNDEAQTDMKTIWLPYLDPDADIGDKEVFMGNFVHECGHCRYTDPLRPEFHQDKFMHALSNCCEDVRMEDLLMQRFPGARYYLGKVTEANKAGWLKKFAAKNVDEETLFSMIALFSGKYLCSQRTECLPLAEAAEKRVSDKRKLAAFKALVAQIKNCKSMQDSEDLARQMWLLVKGGIPAQMFQDNSGNNGSNRSDSATNQDSGPQNQNQSNSAGNSADQGQDQNQTNRSEMSGGQDNGQSTSDGYTMTDEDIMNLLSGNTDSAQQNQNDQSNEPSYGIQDFIRDADLDGKRFNDLLDQAKDNNVSLPDNLSQDDLSGKKQTCPPVVYRAEEAEAVMREAALIQNGLKRSLRVILEARGRTKAAVGVQGRTLERTKLARLGTWDLRVFKKETETKTRSVAVHILVDRSGSMSKANMHAAKVAALAAYKAVAAAPDADPGVSVFPGYGRGHQMEVCIPHGCSRKLQNETKKFASVTAFGFTPFRKAVEGCRAILSNQNCDRRVLIVLTDGALGNSDMDEGLRTRLRRDGVELCLITIGRGRNPFPDFVEHHKDISEAKDIVPALLSMTREMVLN
jgi:hypothetical protein